MIFEQIKFENKMNNEVDKSFRKILIDIDKMTIKENKIFVLSVYETLRSLQNYLKYWEKIPQKTQVKFLNWIKFIYDVCKSWHK